MKRKLRKGLAAASVVCVVFTGVFVAVNFREIAAWLRSTDGFRPLDTEPRVLCESGAEPIAARVANHLREAVDRVQTEQNRSFAGPVRVYVCSTDDSYYKFTASRSRGVVFSGKLFLNGKRLSQRPESIAPILTHELSHLHFSQRLGTMRYLRNIPGWFREGLAVYVSGGGGAEVSEMEATDDLLAGEHFLPALNGDRFFPLRRIRQFSTTHEFDANPRGKARQSRMWSLYRQASMFVGFIKDHNPNRFGTFLLALQDGVPFRDAWARSFDSDVATFWREFRSSLRKKEVGPAR